MKIHSIVCLNIYSSLGTHSTILNMIWPSEANFANPKRFVVFYGEFDLFAQTIIDHCNQILHEILPVSEVLVALCFKVQLSLLTNH